MIKAFVAASFIVFSSCAAAESAFFDAFSIELPPGWNYQIERSSPSNSDFSDRISVRRAEGAGVLYLQTHATAATVDAAALRNLTNVPSTVFLENRVWGDYSGYQHDYFENGRFYRTWWLANGTDVLFITYQCGEGQESLELSGVERIVRSVSSVTLQNRDTNKR